MPSKPVMRVTTGTWPCRALKPTKAMPMRAMRWLPGHSHLKAYGLMRTVGFWLTSEIPSGMLTMVDLDSASEVFEAASSSRSSSTVARVHRWNKIPKNFKIGDDDAALFQ